MTRKLIFIFLGILIATGAYVLVDWMTVIPDSVPATFVGRDSCIECHKQQADLFHGSHHDLAMDKANEKTVLADFDDASITSFGIESRFYRKDDKFMVHTEGPDGKMQDYEVKYVFGVEPLQQYMVEFNRPEDMPENEIARVQVLSLAWDTTRKRWFQLQPPDVKQKIEPGDPLHWTGRTQCWNTSCADCHSTNLKKNFDLKTGVYHTTFSEIDVSCEACHGPGSHHVKMAKSTSLFWDRKKGYGLAQLKGDDSTNQIETCAKCHSRRGELQEGFCGGKAFHDYYSTELLRQQTYHDDGQIKDEVYVYGSFLQSKMYHEGIRCTDCHDPHSTRVKFEGNKLCTSCHAHPAGKYDTVNHHRHKEGSKGALCVECHMPETTYMHVDPRRDHSLRIPRPDLSVKLQTPNACTQCHIDSSKLPPKEQRLLDGKQYLDWLNLAKTNTIVADELARLDQWADRFLLEWHGEEKRTPHFASVFHRIRTQPDDKDAADALRKMLSDRNTPDIVRGTAALELTRNSDALRQVVTRAYLGDSKELMSPSLRQLQEEESILAIQGLLMSIESEIGAIVGADWKHENDISRLSGALSKYKETLIRLHHHPRRLVRIESARILLRMPYQVRNRLLESSDREIHEKVFDELVESARSNQERGSALMALGTIYQLKSYGAVFDRRQVDPGEAALSDKYFNLARQAYRDAIRVAPGESGARGNLVAMNDGLIRRYQIEINQPDTDASKREELLKLIDEIESQNRSLQKEELAALGKEAERAIQSNVGADVLDRYAMKLYLDGQLDRAEEYLAMAAEWAPDNPDILLHYSLLLEKQKKYVKALEFADKLIELVPNNPSYLKMRDNLARMVKQ